MLSFAKEMYPKIALLKAAYFFSDRAYIHLDANDKYYLVNLSVKLDVLRFQKTSLSMRCFVSVFAMKCTSKRNLFGNC